MQVAEKVTYIHQLLTEEARLPRTIQLRLIAYRQRIAALEAERGEFLRSLRRLMPSEDAF